MPLDAYDIISSAIDKLKTSTGLKLVAVFFVIQLLNSVITLIPTAGSTLTALSILLSLGLGVASLIVTIGAFRSLESGLLDIAKFQENIKWPVIRLAAYGVMVSLISNSIASLLVGLTQGSTSALVIASVTLPIVILVAYASLALLLTLPEIALDDRRLFEALDRSFQKTRGEKIEMFKALGPVIALYIITGGLSLALGAPVIDGSVNIVSALLNSVLGSVSTVLLAATVIEFHRRLF